MGRDFTDNVCFYIGAITLGSRFLQELCGTARLFFAVK
jgi:hypothetical protein